MKLYVPAYFDMTPVAQVRGFTMFTSSSFTSHAVSGTEFSGYIEKDGCASHIDSASSSESIFRRDPSALGWSLRLFFRGVLGAGAKELDGLAEVSEREPVPCDGTWDRISG